MANVLIVYATKEGQTETIARHAADCLRARGHFVELVDADRREARELGRFDAVIIGAPIHARGYPRSIVRFARERAAFLDSVSAAFFSVGLAVMSHKSDGRAQTMKIIEQFTQRTGFRPQRVELFAGALRYSRYNFLVRALMRYISAKEGGDTDTSRDYEYTDFDAVERFALEFVDAAVRRGSPLFQSIDVQKSPARIALVGS
jgi:menaquinone-dependent protoporphyrinogen oxidase